MSEVDARPAVPAKAGDFVELRCGVIVGPLCENDDKVYPLGLGVINDTGRICTWCADGRAYVNKNQDQADIVAIIPQPNSAKEQSIERSGGVQMRVGGRYRLRNGEVWTCDHEHGGIAYCVASDRDQYGNCFNAWVNQDGKVSSYCDNPHDVIAEVTDDATSEPQQVDPPSQPSRYHRQFCGVTLDLYRVANLWGVTSHALFHALKKIMMAGQRGSKDYETDLREAIVAIEEELKIAREGGA